VHFLQEAFSKVTGGEGVQQHTSLNLTKLVLILMDGPIAASGFQ